MKYLIFVLLLFFSNLLLAQHEISGRIVDENDDPVIGANIYLAGTYDGASSDENGGFGFLTEENGDQVLIATSIGFKKLEKPIRISGSGQYLEIELTSDINVIDEVVITAGSFETSDTKKAVVLRPFDIVTTAGATADIAGVMNNLPGTQTVAEDGKLYVRGGDSREIKAFVDDMLVSEPFDITPSNIPSRFRFSPFLFKGTFFSTGGYSAEYGNALSSVLVLNTNDLPARSQTDISIMSVGADINQTVRWDNSSLYAQLQYTDLTPYYKIVPQKYDWKSAPGSFSGIVHYKSQLKKGLLKFYSNYQHSDLNVSQPYFMDVTTNEWVEVRNNYYYNNLSADYQVKDNTSLKGGVSGSYFDNQSQVGPYGKRDREWDFHTKLVMDMVLSDKLFLKSGVENFYNNCDRDLSDDRLSSGLKAGYANALTAGFTEMDIYLPFKVVIRPGVRVEHASYIGKSNVSPRFSLAYKVSKNGQLSAAFGKFYQLPDREYMLDNQKLNYELATHYILNYQIDKEGIIFRSELFLKDYDDLITYRQNAGESYQNIANAGNGVAKGLDLFWRDRKTLKNGDYWISYSLVDSERNFRDYGGSYAPPYVSRHNLSIVYKQFFEKIRSQIGITYHFSSSRTFDDPNTEAFLDQKTKPYHDLSANLSVVYKPNIIFHFSVSNVLGIKHEFGRQYSSVPNDDGYYESVSVNAHAKRFLFLGCFITFSKDKEANQLNNL